MNKTIEQIIPEIDIDLGNGEKHKVVCNFGVLCRFERMSGKSCFNPELMKDFTIQDGIKLIAAAIYEEDPASHLLELEKKLGGSHLKTVGALIRKLFGNDDSDEEKETNTTEKKT